MKIARLGFLLRLVLACTLSAALCRGQCEVLKLTGPPPDPYYARFGFSVSLQGDRMAIGKPNSFTLAGSVDLFERQDGVGWVPVGTLVASDFQDVEEFGYSVAIDGDRLVVGATHDGLLFAKGAAYVFERQIDGTWLETAKLLPPSEAWAFGWSVDIDGDRIAVGAKGASTLGEGKGKVVVFERLSGAWVKKATIKPLVAAVGDGFGASLDLEGERIVVGAPYQWASTSPYEGLAFVFERSSATVWIQKAMLSPADLQDNDAFGQDVALDGNRIVVGAPLYDQPSPFVGAAFVFDLIGGMWTQTAKLSPSDHPTLTDFGWSVDVEGTRTVVGAQNGDGAARGAGAAYLFEERSSVWVEVEKFQGSGVQSSDTFGYVLDLEGPEVLIGAPHAASGLGHPGYAFLFSLDPAGPSLLADAISVSLSQGGGQDHQLGACLEHAGDLYFLAGSATGTSPGFVFGGLPVPLNPDPYFFYTLNNPGVPPLATSLGVLDAWGKGSASFSVPPGTSATLTGLTLHHAYAVLDAATLQLEAVSPAVPVALVP